MKTSSQPTAVTKFSLNIEGYHTPALSYKVSSKQSNGCSNSKSLNHRIIERFGLEGTLKIIWFQPPCHEQGHLH